MIEKSGLEMIIELSESPEMTLHERFGQHGKNERVDETSFVNLYGIMKAMAIPDDPRTIEDLMQATEDFINNPLLKKYIDVEAENAMLKTNVAMVVPKGTIIVGMQELGGEEPSTWFDGELKKYENDPEYKNEIKSIERGENKSVETM